MIPPCCCGCTVYSDNFATSLDSGWEQVAGSWTVSAGNLTIASPSPLDRIVRDPPPADSFTYFGFTARLQGTSDGDELGVVIHRNTSTGHFSYVALEIGSSDAVVRVYKNTGSDAVSASAHVVAAPGEYHRLRVCGNGGINYVYLNDKIVLKFNGSGLTDFGAPVIGAISRTAVGTHTWDWLKVSKSDTLKCACLPCTKVDTLDEFDHDFPLWFDHTGSTFTINSGKLRSTDPSGTIAGTLRRCTRCAMTPELDGMDIAISCDSYWQVIGAGIDAITGIVITTDGSFAWSQGTIEWRSAPSSVPPPDAGWTYKIHEADGSSTTGTIVGTPVVGETLTVQITDTSSGTGTYTVTFLVNGVTKHTVTDVKLTFGQQFFYGAFAKTIFGTHADWDNFFYDAAV